MGNWLDDRAAQRRRQADATADRRRQDAIAAAEVEAIKQRARLEVQQATADHADKRRRELRKERQREKDAAAARRTLRFKKLAAWAAAHMVDLMIYPLAVVSAVMAVPAMAHFGRQVYGTGTGAALPIITELGMWAFAFAVQYTHHVHPDRPVWALQVGVWTFAGVGATLNYLDGVEGRGDVGHGIVMGVVSIAGVVAHQLVTAAPRRSRAERDALRFKRHAADKIAAVRKAVINASVARVDGVGGVDLMFRPGDYMLNDRRELDPIAPVGDTTIDEWDRRVQQLLRNPVGPPDGDSISTPIEPSTVPPITPPIAPPIDVWTAPSTLAPITTSPIDVDSRGDQGGSTPIDPPDRPAGSTPGSTIGGAKDRPQRRARNRAARRPTEGRSIDQLRADLDRAIADPAVEVDPASAESIRRALRCSPKRARMLRDEHVNRPRG